MSRPVDIEVSAPAATETGQASAEASDPGRDAARAPGSDLSPDKDRAAGRAQESENLVQ